VRPAFKASTTPSAALKNPFQIRRLLVASEHDPEGILQLMLPLMAPSRQFVAYGWSPEALTRSFHQLKSGNLALNIDLTETWYRPSQVLPGRTHPEMQMSSSSSGYILSGTTVSPLPQSPWLKDLFSLLPKKSLKHKLDEGGPPDASGSGDQQPTVKSQKLDE